MVYGCAYKISSNDKEKKERRATEWGAQKKGINLSEKYGFNRPSRAYNIRTDPNRRRRVHKRACALRWINFVFNKTRMKEKKKRELMFMPQAGLHINAK